jgi:hypothetical protein
MQPPKTTHIRNRTQTSIVTINGHSYFKSFIAEDEPQVIAETKEEKTQTKDKKEDDRCRCNIL